MSRLTLCLLQLLINGPLTLDALYRLAGDEPRAIRTRLQNLTDQGWVVLTGTLWTLTETGRLAATAAPAPTRQPLYVRAWVVLRHLKVADLGELARAAGQDGEASVGPRLTAYFNALERAGLVVRARCGGAARFGLIADPGPHAPRVRSHTQTVLEPNSGRVIDIRRGGRRG
ncbi:hypothetical protein [Chitiniphilus eburneus]|uniref:hypothetical protein n=1 Tax=Chitiniphilus eburneus TaxID=2571148 RepID=UPI0035CF1CDD